MKSTPRKNAKALGLKYYEGRECQYGHGTRRAVRHGECVTCRYISKGKAKKRKRTERGPVPLGRPRIHAKDATDFEVWVRRKMTGPQSGPRKKLSVEYFKSLYTEVCPLLNLPLTYSSPPRNVPDNYATLDKIDPMLGYVEGNVQIISFKANRIKNDATLEEMQLIVKNWAALVS